MFKIALFLLVAMQGFFFLADAQALFSNPDPVKVSLIDQNRLKNNTGLAYVKRYQIVAHNGGILNPTGKQTVVLNLFQDTKITVNIEKVQIEGANNLWIGTVEGVPISNVEIYYNGESVDGKIDIGTQLFSITCIDGTTLIREIDKSKMPSVVNDQKYVNKH